MDETDYKLKSIENLLKIVKESITYKGYLLYPVNNSINIMFSNGYNLRTLTTLEDSNLEEARSYIDLLG